MLVWLEARETGHLLDELKVARLNQIKRLLKQDLLVMVKLPQIIPQQLMNCLLAVMAEHRKVHHLAEDSQAMIGLLQIIRRLVMN